MSADPDLDLLVGSLADALAGHEAGGRPVDVVMPDEAGPILVRGPVAVRLADGTTSVSGRPTVALCTCRRSRIYPFCDASHRRRSAPPQARRPGADAGKAPRK